GGGGPHERSSGLSPRVDGGGGGPGCARLAGEGVRWSRMFSLALRPRRVLARQGLAVASRRSPEGPERLVLPDGWVVLCCVAQRSTIEIAMPATTVTGFLSWLEAAPPGAVSRIAT